MKKIPYSKEVAQAITPNKNTIRTWQRRGYIPITAFKPKPAPFLNDKTEKVKNLYNTTALKKSPFNDQFSYYAKFYDFCTKDIPLTQSEFLIVETTLKSYESVLDDVLTLLRISQTAKALKLLFTIVRPYLFLKKFYNPASIYDRVKRSREFNDTEQAKFIQEVKLLKYKITQINSTQIND